MTFLKGTLQNQKVQAWLYQVSYLEPHYGERSFIKERVKSQSTA